MKKIFVFAAALACAYSVAFGQGQVNFQNRVTAGSGAQGTVLAKVLNVGGVDNVLGTGFTIELWAGPSGTAAGSLSLVPGTTSTFRTSTSVAGYIVAGITATVPGVDAGATGSFQVRAWNNEGGTLTSWQQALAAGRAFGSSPVLNLTFPLGGGTVQPPNLVGLQGFTLVPEPSSIAFAVMGGLGLLALRRRK